MIADALNGDIITDPDAIINEMLDSSNHIDTGDGFSDFVDEFYSLDSFVLRVHAV